MRYLVFTLLLTFGITGAVFAEAQPPEIPNYEDMDFDELPYQEKWTHQSNSDKPSILAPPTCIGYSEIYAWSNSAYGTGFTSCNGVVEYIAAINYLYKDSIVVDLDEDSSFNATFAQANTGGENMRAPYDYWTRTEHYSLWGTDSRFYQTVDYL